MTFYTNKMVTQPLLVHYTSIHNQILATTQQNANSHGHVSLNDMNMSTYIVPTILVFPTQEHHVVWQKHMLQRFLPKFLFSLDLITQILISTVIRPENDPHIPNQFQFLFILINQMQIFLCTRICRI